MKLAKLIGRGMFLFAIFNLMFNVILSFTRVGGVELLPLANDGSSIVKEGSKGIACKLYDELRLDLAGLSRNAYESALEGYYHLKNAGVFSVSDQITIIDYSLPSDRKRLFLINLKAEKLIMHTYVAHGQGSGGYFARKFSNRPNSYQSSLGFFRTSGTYQGKHGYTMKLVGLEKGINDLVDDRAIVLHSASYVSERYIRSRGMLGRSQGCPAVPEYCHRQLIDLIKGGQCFFIYAPDNRYFSRSAILNS